MDMVSREQISEARLTDWRKLGQGLHARFAVEDFAAGARFVGDIAARHEAPAEPGAVTAVEVVLDTADPARVAPVWAALLAGDSAAQGRGTIGNDVRDATRRVPILSFQDTEPHETPRQRFHIDVQVPYDVAEQRIAAAVAAGGVVVDDSRAPNTTVIADPDGNKACIGVFQPPA